MENLGSIQADDRPEEIDFSRGQRGKFYRQDVRINQPVYLDDEVLSYLSQVAAKKGLGVSQVANDLLRKEIAIIESLK
jgi:hypothetical protein